MLKLEVINGPRKGRQVRVSDDAPVPIGRNVGRLRLHDSRVSKHHAEIRFVGGSWVLRDLGSSNGSFVNRRVMRGLAELEKGDVLQFGRVVVKVREANAEGVKHIGESEYGAAGLEAAAPTAAPPKRTAYDDEPSRKTPADRADESPLMVPATTPIDDELDLDALFAEADEHDGAVDEDDEPAASAVDRVAPDSGYRAASKPPAPAETPKPAEPEPDRVELDALEEEDASGADGSDASSVLIESGIFDPVPGEAGWVLDGVDSSDSSYDADMLVDPPLETAGEDEAPGRPVAEDKAVAEPGETAKDKPPATDASPQTAQAGSDNNNKEDEAEQPVAAQAPAPGDLDDQVQIDDDLPDAGQMPGTTLVLPNETIAAAAGSDRSIMFQHEPSAEDTAAGQDDEPASRAEADDSDDAIGLADDVNKPSVFDHAAEPEAPAAPIDEHATDHDDDLIRIGEDEDSPAEQDAAVTAAKVEPYEDSDALPMPEEAAPEPQAGADAAPQPDPVSAEDATEPEATAAIEPELHDPVQAEASTREPGNDGDNAESEEVDDSTAVSAHPETDTAETLDTSLSAEPAEPTAIDDEGPPAEAPAVAGQAEPVDPETAQPPEAFAEPLLAADPPEPFSEPEVDAEPEPAVEDVRPTDIDPTPDAADQADESAETGATAEAGDDAEPRPDTPPPAADTPAEPDAPGIDELRAALAGLSLDDEPAPTAADALTQADDAPAGDPAPDLGRANLVPRALQDTALDDIDEPADASPSESAAVSAETEPADTAAAAPPPDQAGDVPAGPTQSPAAEIEADLEDLLAEDDAEPPVDPSATDFDAPSPLTLAPGSADAVARELDQDEGDEHAARRAVAGPAAGPAHSTDARPAEQLSAAREPAANPSSTLPPAEPRRSTRSCPPPPAAAANRRRVAATIAGIALVLAAAAALYLTVINPQLIAGRNTNNSPTINPANTPNNPATPGNNPRVTQDPNDRSPDDPPLDPRSSQDPADRSAIGPAPGEAHTPDPFAAAARVLGAGALTGRTTDDPAVQRPDLPGLPGPDDNTDGTGDNPSVTQRPTDPDPVPMPPVVVPDPGGSTTPDPGSTPGNTPGTNPGDTPTEQTADNTGEESGGNTSGGGVEPDPTLPTDGDRLVFLVDCSGSLVDSLPQMLLWLREAIDTLDDEETFTIIFFKQGQAIETLPTGLQPLTRAYQRALHADWLDPAAAPVLPAGRSDPSAGLALALSYEPSDLYLLSDESFGQRTGDTTPGQAIDLFTNALGDAEVRVHGVQFFYDNDNGTLENIAEQFNGTYEFVEETRHPDQDPIDLLEELEGRNR